MLTYHQALDPYHAAFRILRILLTQPLRAYEYDKLRIIDFYLTFPNLIKTIRIPPKYRSLRTKVSLKENKYLFTGHPILVFRQLASIQDAATRLLLSYGLIEKKQYLKGYIKLGKELPENLENTIKMRNLNEKDLVDFLVNKLGALPLTSKDGIKHRTGLMEYKYDAI